MKVAIADYATDGPRPSQMIIIICLIINGADPIEADEWKWSDASGNTRNNYNNYTGRH